MVYAAALMPLIIFSQYISPFHFGKVVVFRSWVELMLALYIPLAWKNPEFRPRRDKFFWAFLGFTLAFTLATITSVNPFISFWGTLERMGGLFSFWHYFVFYVILVAVLRTKEDWLTFLKITVVVGLLSAFYGFGQKTNISFFIGSGDRARIFGTIGNAALFAGYQIFNVFLALMLGLTEARKSWRNFYFIAAFLMSVAVFMTAVRGSVLGLGVGLVLFAALYFFETNSKVAKKVFTILVGLAVIFAAAVLFLRNTSFIKNSSYLNRITDFSTSSYTVQTRFWAWQAGLKGWRDSAQHIVVGWGPENFNIPFSKYFNPKFFNGPGSETLFDRAHNMFIEILVTMGLVGELAYLYIYYVIFTNLWQIKKKPETRVLAWGLISMTVAYIIHNSFIFDTSANFLVFFSILGFMAWLSRSAPEPAPALNHKKSNPILVFALVILAIILAYQTNIKTSIANYTTTRGIIAGDENDFNSAVADYEKATSYNNIEGRYEYRNQFAQFLVDYSTSNDISSANVQDAYQAAIKLELKNAQENPRDYLPELYLSRLYIILGQSDSKSPYNDDALQHSTKALSYSPTFVRTYYEVAQAYLNKKDYKDAEAAFQKAVDLNPDVGLSWYYVGATQIEAGDIQDGTKTLTKALDLGYQFTENDYLNLANAYIKANDYPHLVTVYEALTKLAPTNAQYAAYLAVAYAHVGRIADAVKEAHVAAQIDPSFEPQAKSFVQSIGGQW